MRFGFLIKAIALLALVTLCDRLLVDDVVGIATGALAAAWLVALILARPDVRRNRQAAIPLAAAALFAAALIDDPGPLAWILFWSALSFAALLPRTARFDDAWHWVARLLLHGATSFAAPIRDLRQLWRRRAAGTGPRAIAATLALPIIGGVLFVLLFASANPLIAQALAAVRWPSPWQVALWIVVTVMVWPSLRPLGLPIRIARLIPDPEPRLPGTSLPSVLASLTLFNAIFAVQNTLDIVFLWNGGALPAGMNQSDYVHRGAYPLIATALIAGVMTLAMLRPGSASAAHPLARRLVTLWVVQNIVLVASSALRTIDYIETSMLTAWRIAGLAWMALVAIGLALILARILMKRSARWLVNRNALAAMVILIPCAFVDLPAVAADWNARHGDPERVDLCYLAQVGDGAILPLIAFERRAITASTRDRARAVRDGLMTALMSRQHDWSDWTPRGARRLAAARALLGPNPPQPRPLPASAWRACDGSIRVPPPPPSAPTAMPTPTPERPPAPTLQPTGVRP